MAVEVSVTGLRELEAALDRLGGFQAQAIRERAIAAGGKVAAAAVRVQAPKGPTGNLRRLVGARKGRVQGAGRDPSVIVVGSTARHRHLVIRGTAARQTRNGANRGVMPANPFVDRAWQASQGAVMGVIRGVYAVEVKKAWHR